MTEPTPLQTAFPLQEGFVIAQYVNDMRETVRYDRPSETYVVRYDWLDQAGQQTGYDAKPIRAEDLKGVPRIELLVSKRRREVLEHRASPQ